MFEDIKLHAVCLNYFFIVSTESLITPIFVPAAISRDVEKIAILFTYCMFHVTACIATPIIAWNMKYITRDWALRGGVLVTCLGFL